MQRKKQLIKRINEIEKKLDMYEQKATNQSYGSLSHVDGAGQQVIDHSSPLSKASKQDTLRNDNSEGYLPNGYNTFGSGIKMK